jgi:hypothetical protein
MYSMLNSEMIRASQVDRNQDELLAEHRRTLRELRGSAPGRGRQLRRLAAIGVALSGGGGTHSVRTSSDGADLRRLVKRAER